MTNWLIEQQIILSLVLLSLIIIEAKAVNILGAKLIYGLWCLVPLVLIANSLPQNLVEINSSGVYRYIVAAEQWNKAGNVSVNWFAVWALGCFIILSLATYAQFKIDSLISSAKPIQMPKFCLPRGMQLFSSEHFSGPILSGLLRPKLLVPNNFCDDFSEQQQQQMLTHELVHLKRLDNGANLLALVMLALFWFNPISWLAYRAFRRSQELSCDAKVLANSVKQDQITYCQALVQCAQHSTHSFSIYSPYGEKSTMLKRIQTIQTSSKAKPLIIALCITFSSALLGSVAIAKLGEPTHAVNSDVMATPVMRVDPLYPAQAAVNKQEGSVILQFDIDKNGRPQNIQVLESIPQQIFDKSAVEALSQWQYKPRIQGGKAQKQTGLKVQLDFKLGAA